MDQNKLLANKWVSGLVVLTGIWLIIAPFVMNYATGGAVNSIIIGVIAIVFGLFQWSDEHAQWPGWVNFVAGIYFLLSPYMFNQGSSNAMANDVIFGIVIAILGLTNGIISSSNKVVRTSDHHHRPI